MHTTLKRTSTALALVLAAQTLPGNAQAARFLFGGSGPIPEGRSTELRNQTVQIMLDDGSLVSLVGAGTLKVSGNAITVDKGGVTVVGAKGSDVTLNFPGGQSADVSGAASLNVGSSGVTGNVMGGDVTVTSGGRSRTFRPGAAWQANQNAAPGRVFANGAQQTPTVANLSEGRFAAAAINGLPVALGDALAAIGVGGDIVTAAQQLGARVDNPALGALPSGDVEALIGFSQQLASALGGGVAFSSAQPALIEAYLGYLAQGGEIAQFQSEYTALITQYLDLLAGGSLPAAFTGLDLSAVNAYLSYLNSEGAIAALAENQRAIVSAYLDFLSGGGAPTDFLPPAAGLTDAAIAAYVMAIEDYVALLGAGGNPADFALGTDIIEQYLQQLSDGGVLATLLPDVATALEDYLTFIGEGGSPADFDGFDMAMGGGDMGGGDMGGGDMGGGDMGGGDMGGGQTDFAAVGPNFSLNNAYVLAGFNYTRDPDILTTGSTQRSGQTIARGDDGVMTRASFDNGGIDQPIFDVTDLTLEDLRGSDRILLGRYGAGMAMDVLGFGDIAVTVFDLVSIADQAELLPVSGDISYTITQTNPVILNNADATTIDFTGAARLVLGPVPRLGAQITLQSDVDYIFETLGGLDGAGDTGQVFTFIQGSISSLLDLTSGDGALCNDMQSCRITTINGFTSGFDQSGMIVTFRGADQGTGSALLAADADPVISFDPGAGVSSGTLTAAFATTDGELVYANGGGANNAFSFTSAAFTNSHEFDSQGLVRAGSLFEGNLNVNIDRELTSIADLAGDTTWQIGRFNGGPISSDLTNLGGVIYGPNGGLPYAIVAPGTNLPTFGVATYSLLGATQPVYGDGRTAPGTFEGDIAIDFGLRRAGLEATVTMPDAVFTLDTIGGVSDLSLAALRSFDGRTFSGSLRPTVSVDTDLCGNTSGQTCRASFHAALGGEDGSLLSFAYIIRNNLSAASSIAGSAVFLGSEPQDIGAPVGDVRTNQVIAYASTEIGIDERFPADVTYDTDTGAVLGYDWTASNQEAPHRGSAEVKDGGSVSDIIGWSRWAGGTSGGQYFQLTPGAVLPDDGGWHLVSGTPATNLPQSGTVNYALVGGTQPTIRDGSLTPGTLTGSAAVAFGTTPTVGVDLNISIGGNTYGLSSPGGAANPGTGFEIGMLQGTDAMSFRSNDVIASGSGPVCSGNGDCTSVITGFLAGEGASHIGMAFTFGNTGFDTQVDGTAVFAAP